MRRSKAQSTVEYAILIIIIVGVFLAMQNYIKRGFQGRWKASLDDYGEQYDPKVINSSINYSTVAESSTVIQAVPGTDPKTGLPGTFTNRTDNSHSIETKNGYTNVGTTLP